ncbi:MAG: hypothetical protein A2Z25_09605 [Planctomycetes bacterium RBG_16_55_9]|nr:MAG: hypothetical protein A2Z25_09605 [Planctomycetes bacterium RBG_16_55_9]
MKDSKKYHIIVLAALVSFALGGCSSVKSTSKTSVRDFVVQVTNVDSPAVEPSSAPSDRPIRHWSAPLKSVPTLRTNVKQPAAQKVQGNLLEASDMRDVESTRQSQPSEPVTKRPEKPKVTSQSRQTASVEDVLTEVLSASRTAGQSTVSNGVVQVIAAAEIAEDDNTNKESSTK